jgi:hypothetical protein
MKNYFAVNIKGGQLEGCESLEDMFCLATLIATGELSPDSNIGQVRKYYRKIETCDNCPYVKKCLAVQINK